MRLQGGSGVVPDNIMIDKVKVEITGMQEGGTASLQTKLIVLFESLRKCVGGK